MPPKNPASAKFDFKKVYKDCYAPKPTPSRVKRAFICHFYNSRLGRYF